MTVVPGRLARGGRDRRHQADRVRDQHRGRRQTIRSNSLEGQSQVFVEFRLGTDMTRAMQDVRDKIALVRPAFPRDVKDPLVHARRRGQPAAGGVAGGAVADDRAARAHLAHRSDRSSRRLENVPGVARSTSAGGVTRQILMQIKPSALHRFRHRRRPGRSPPIRNANQDVPAGRITRGAAAIRSCASKARSRIPRSSAASSSRSRAARRST